MSVFRLLFQNKHCFLFCFVCFVSYFRWRDNNVCKTRFVGRSLSFQPLRRRRQEDVGFGSILGYLWDAVSKGLQQKETLILDRGDTWAWVRRTKEKFWCSSYQTASRLSEQLCLLRSLIPSSSCTRIKTHSPCLLARLLQDPNDIINTNVLQNCITCA